MPVIINNLEVIAPPPSGDSEQLPSVVPDNKQHSLKPRDIYWANRHLLSRQLRSRTR